MRRLSIIPRRGTKLAAAPAKSKATSRRPAAPRWLAPTLRYGGAALGLALLAGGGYWMWSSGYVATQFERAQTSLVAATARAGLAVSDVYVVGRGETTRDALIAAIGIDIGDPMITFDPVAARDRIVALGWVREAVVERRLPGTVMVRIEEREPMALWQRSGKLVVIDRDGVVIPGARALDFNRLPVIVGDDAPRHVARLLAVLASEPDLSKRVQAAVRVGGRRWNLKLDNDIGIELPEEGVAEAWRRLAEFDRRHKLLTQDISAIDLRLPDRVVVRPPEFNPAPEGENT